MCVILRRPGRGGWGKEKETDVGFRTASLQQTEALRRSGCLQVGGDHSRGVSCSPVGEEGDWGTAVSGKDRDQPRRMLTAHKECAKRIAAAQEFEQSHATVIPTVQRPFSTR